MLRTCVSSEKHLFSSFLSPLPYPCVTVQRTLRTWQLPYYWLDIISCTEEIQSTRSLWTPTSSGHLMTWLPCISGAKWETMHVTFFLYSADINHYSLYGSGWATESGTKKQGEKKKKILLWRFLRISLPDSSHFFSILEYGVVTEYSALRIQCGKKDPPEIVDPTSPDQNLEVDLRPTK